MTLERPFYLKCDFGRRVQPVTSADLKEKLKKNPRSHYHHKVSAQRPQGVDSAEVAKQYDNHTNQETDRPPIAGAQDD